jgi:hypothetical protein
MLHACVAGMLILSTIATPGRRDQDREPEQEVERGSAIAAGGVLLGLVGAILTIHGLSEAAQEWGDGISNSTNAALAVAFFDDSYEPHPVDEFSSGDRAALIGGAVTLAVGIVLVAAGIYDAQTQTLELRF